MKRAKVDRKVPTQVEAGLVAHKVRGIFMPPVYTS